MLSVDTTLANAMLTSLVAAADAGSGAAKIQIYNGTVPVNVNAALASNTLLAELVCSDPCGTVATKTLTFDAVTDDTSIDATGTATFFRLVDSDNNAVIQGSVTASGGGGDLQLQTVSLVAGGTVHLTSAAITLP